MQYPQLLQLPVILTLCHGCDCTLELWARGNPYIAFIGVFYNSVGGKELIRIDQESRE